VAGIPRRDAIMLLDVAGVTVARKELPMDGRLLAFLGVATLITITPGADTLLIVRNVLTRGRGAGCWTMAGIYGGLTCHATLAILGLSAILVRSATLFQGVKLLGAAYLCYLGTGSLWSVWWERGTAGAPAITAHPGRGAAGAGSPWRSLREGCLSNLLNPKPALFYLALLPQFLRPGDPARATLVLLAALHFAIGVVWLGLLIVLAGRLRSWLLRPAIRRRLEAASGAVLVALGVRLALEGR
jgi:threonine/homoserine/homoserine lactone efflux protein